MIQEILIIKIKWWKFLLLSTTLAVSGCGLFSSFSEKVMEEDNKMELEVDMEYETAGKNPPLEVPPDLTEPASEDRYIVPDLKPSESKTYSAYSRERASGKDSAELSSTLLPETSSDSMVRIERSGTQRWLVVKSNPEEVWPIVKDFWNVMGFTIKVEVPEAGVMETDWAENRAGIPDSKILRALSAIEFDKFRSRLERGEAGTTEIYISHRAMEDRPSDPDLEAEMLARLMMHFGVAEERARSVLANSSTKERAHFNPEDGGILTVDGAFDRSWRRVGLALDRIGFTVEDRDRSEGIYFVRYVDPDNSIDDKDDDTSILDSLAFWDDDDKERKKPDQYRVQVSGTESGSEVKVFRQDGKPDNSDVAGRILNLLYEQLK
jgi:outer membrane protein assembly factor BamC